MSERVRERGLREHRKEKGFSLQSAVENDFLLFWLLGYCVLSIQFNSIKRTLSNIYIKSLRERANHNKVMSLSRDAVDQRAKNHT